MNVSFHSTSPTSIQFGWGRRKKIDEPKPDFSNDPLFPQYVVNQGAIDEVLMQQHVMIPGAGAASDAYRESGMNLLLELAGYLKFSHSCVRQTEVNKPDTVSEDTLKMELLRQLPPLKSISENSPLNKGWLNAVNALETAGLVAFTDRKGTSDTLVVHRTGYQITPLGQAVVKYADRWACGD